MKTVHLLISGKVQGVFFRQSASEVAQELNIKGWIRNTRDSKVESVITGSADDVNDFINWCKKGPEKADVKEVIVSRQPDTIFRKFEVIRGK